MGWLSHNLFISCVFSWAHFSLQFPNGGSYQEQWEKPAHNTDGPGDRNPNSACYSWFLLPCRRSMDSEWATDLDGFAKRAGDKGLTGDRPHDASNRIVYGPRDRDITVVFYRAADDSKKLRRSIYLRLAIIAGFFFGGVLGGFIYREMQLKGLLFSSAWLVVALLYDNIRLGFHYYRRKLKGRT